MKMVRNFYEQKYKKLSINSFQNRITTYVFNASLTVLKNFFKKSKIGEITVKNIYMYLMCIFLLLWIYEIDFPMCIFLLSQLTAYINLQYPVGFTGRSNSPIKIYFRTVNLKILMMVFQDIFLYNIAIHLSKVSIYIKNITVTH